MQVVLGTADYGRAVGMLSVSDQEALRELTAVGWYALGLSERLLTAGANVAGRAYAGFHDEIVQAVIAQNYRTIRACCFHSRATRRSSLARASWCIACTIEAPWPRAHARAGALRNASHPVAQHAPACAGWAPRRSPSRSHSVTAPWRGRRRCAHPRRRPLRYPLGGLIRALARSNGVERGSTSRSRGRLRHHSGSEWSAPPSRRRRLR